MVKRSNIGRENTTYRVSIKDVAVVVQFQYHDVNISCVTNRILFILVALKQEHLAFTANHNDIE